MALLIRVHISILFRCIKFESELTFALWYPRTYFFAYPPKTPTSHDRFAGQRRLCDNFKLSILLCNYYCQVVVIDFPSISNFTFASHTSFPSLLILTCATQQNPQSSSRTGLHYWPKVDKSIRDHRRDWQRCSWQGQIRTESRDERLCRHQDHTAFLQEA